MICDIDCLFLCLLAIHISLLVRCQSRSFLFFIAFFYKNLFTLFLALLGLRRCVQAFSSCSERGLLFIAVRGLLIAVASRCGAWALGARASVVVARGL